MGCESSRVDSDGEVETENDCSCGTETDYGYDLYRAIDYGAYGCGCGCGYDYGCDYDHYNDGQGCGYANGPVHETKLARALRQMDLHQLGQMAIFVDHNCHDGSPRQTVRVPVRKPVRIFSK